jgi:arylsulfatase A-like enzyme
VAGRRGSLADPGYGARVRSRLTGLTWLLAWLTGCAPPAPPSNLVLISLDTLVPGRMSTYGNPRPTTPAVSELAARGIVFTQAFSPSSWTLPAHAAMLTGRYPMSLAANPDDLGLYRAAPLLAERFQSAGYRTGAVVGGGFVSATFGANRGFDFFEEGDAERAASWLEDEPREPFFLFFHTFLPHGRYSDRRFAAGLPPGRLEGAFAASGDPRASAICCKGGFEATPAEREYLLALYDGAIARADDAVALLVAALARLDASDRTTVVVTSDHGEEFWQHSGLAVRHGHTLYDELLRIPLVWSEPGLARAGTRCAAPASLVDLVPTVVTRFGLEGDGESDGIDLSAWLDECPDSAERVLLAEGIHSGPSRYSVRTSRGKLIETPEPGHQRGLGRRDPVPVRAPLELYLPDDVDEQHNAIDEHPELAAELQALLQVRRPSRPGTLPGPAQRTLNARMLEQLRELGYVR